MSLRFLFLFASLGAALFLSGCAPTEIYEADKAPEYQIIREFSPFYQDGPMQPRGPDLSLRTNERVKLLKKDFTGFAWVEISDGRRGYLPFEDLAPAPPKPAPTPDPVPRSGRRSFADEPAYFGPQNNDVPLPDLNIAPEEVPAAPSMIDAEPETNEKPKFRY